MQHGDPSTPRAHRLEGMATVGEFMPSYFFVLAASYDQARRHGRSLPSLSPAEMLLLDAFRVVGLDPELQAEVGRYDADFLFRAESFCIEVDGRQHEQAFEKDFKRDAYFRGLGIEVIRIPARDVFRDAIDCARKIHATLEIRRRQIARELTILDEDAFVHAVMRIADELLVERGLLEPEEAASDPIDEKVMNGDTARAIRQLLVGAISRGSPVAAETVRMAARKWATDQILPVRRAATTLSL